MKPVIVLMVALLSGCSNAVLVPQDITKKTDMDRHHTFLNHALKGPTVESRSTFYLEEVRITEEANLQLKGRFVIPSDRYKTDSKAMAVYSMEMSNAGGDRIRIGDLSLKEQSLFSVHKPIESTVNKVFRSTALRLIPKIEGKIISGQKNIEMANHINDFFD